MLKRWPTAGEMRHRVTFRKPNATQGASGQPVENWTTEAGVVARDVPAAYRAVGGGEFMRGVQVQANETAIFAIRMPKTYTVLPTYRLYWKGNPWDITRAVDPWGEDTHVYIFASQAVP